MADQTISKLAEALATLRDEMRRQHNNLATGSTNYLGEVVHQKDRDELRRLRALVAKADDALALLADT